MDHPNDLPKELWTTRQVAKFLGVRHNVLLKMVDKGRIPALKVGRDSARAEWRFNADVVRKAKREYDDNEAMCAGMWSVAEVAEYLQMNQESIRRLARQGQLKGIKMHHGYYPQADWRFDPADIRAFLVEKTGH